MIKEKIWGTTQDLVRNPFVQVHAITVKKGAGCSIHKHDARANMFIVGSGVLEVTLHRENGVMHSRLLLHPGDYMIVPPGHYHKFEAQTDVKALEIYWPEGVRDEDIVRIIPGYSPAQD